MTALINLTPHPLNLMDAEGKVLLTLPPQKPAARCSTVRTIAEEVVVGEVKIPLARVTMGEMEGLPPPAPDTLYVVSMIAGTAAAKLGRTDVVVTDDAVRDADGKIIGCRALARP